MLHLKPSWWDSLDEWLESIYIFKKHPADFCGENLGNNALEMSNQESKKCLVNCLFSIYGHKGITIWCFFIIFIYFEDGT